MNNTSSKIVIEIRIPTYREVRNIASPRQVKATPGADGAYGIDWSMTLASPFRKRLDMLIEEFGKLEPGFLNMGDWVYTAGVKDGSKFVREALKNPCGTAACIAGKAGLMKRFRRSGFKWNPREGKSLEYSSSCMGFNVHPQIFFGKLICNHVFTGEWAVDHIDTTAQALLLLKDFRDNVRDVWLNDRHGVEWIPCLETRNAIIDLGSGRGIKQFPVNKAAAIL